MWGPRIPYLLRGLLILNNPVFLPQRECEGRALGTNPAKLP